jgi:hypothetical protein
MNLIQESALAYAEQIAYSTKETLRFTFDVAEQMRGINGVYVECGVAAGAQIIAMAAAAPEKTIYAFDSFQGIPLPSNRDDQYPGIRRISKEEQSKLPNPGEQVLESSGATSVSEGYFMNHLKNSGVDYSNVKIVPGWFEHTVRLFGGMQTRIALLRLDGDLYNSTFECLKYLFPRVIEGGCVIVDDISLPGCKAACDEYFTLIGYTPDWKFISNISYFYK